jgi:rhodanese-related sulfurtransferase
MQKEKAIVIDVREHDEWNTGHAKNSFSFPLSTLKLKINELEKYKNKKIILVCRSGNRAGLAKNILEVSGFKNLLNGGSWENFK